MSEFTTHYEAGPSGLVSRIITGWALMGGVLLLLVVLMHSWSVIGNQFGMPFPGDFEMTEIGIAVVAFSFLPYCQLTDANVTADIFTSRASPHLIALFSLVASLIALAFSGILLWRMYAGMLDQKAYEYETAILQFPTWMAWIPILISLFLLMIASLVTLRHAARKI
ncbi:MAG: TRAP-type C4-dicarboxylate transport system permease small subunit [Paracoccaceae bacterium]|jgi:TRAP-type C4-dicarboxylate transport system permease small subunit